MCVDRTWAFAPDGDFEIRYVPEGDFILKASASLTTPPDAHFADDEDAAVNPAIVSIDLNFGQESAGVAERQAAHGGQSAEMPVTVTGDV